MAMVLVLVLVLGLVLLRGLEVNGFSFSPKTPTVTKALSLRAVTCLRAQAKEEGSRGGVFGRAVTGPYVSLGAGLAGLAAILVNRIALTPVLADSQSRTDLLAVAALGGVVMNGVYLLDVTAKEAETVKQTGSFVQSLDEGAADACAADVAAVKWLCETLIVTKRATASVVVVLGGETVARYGVMGTSSDKVKLEAPIIKKALGLAEETYLPVLQNLPGRFEFDYLPSNCQAVLIVPVRNGAVVMGSSQAKAYAPRDIAWIKGACERVFS